MDPRVLLDPRGAFKRGGPAGQQPNNMSTPQLPQYDPRALMNPKSISKRPASSEGDTNRGRGDQTSPMNPGQISLVERLHNVHERTASPSKRVKTDEEHNKKSHINAAGRGGALDLRPRDGQQIPTAPPGPTAAIDLTMSDDEDADVEVVKDNSAQVICIGKIRQAYVQTTMVPFTDPKKYSGNYGQQSRIKVSFRRGGGHKGTHIIMVTDPTSREFGRVDVKTAQALAPLMDAAKVSGLYWMSWTEPRRKQPSEGPSGSPLNTLIGMTLQLYCPRKVSHDIGRFLKGRGVELVDPQFELSRYDYFNPHTNASFTRADVANPNFEPAGYNNRYAPASGSYVLRSVEEIRADVSNMFDTIAGNDDLPFREPTQLIKTSLYPHQKKALHFMWDKEQDRSGSESDDRKDSLFQAKLRNNGQKYYVHVITGEETKEKPYSVRGGILADDMGLGKTLSVLSLVADDNSMADAKAFTNKAPPPPMAVRHLVGLGDVIRQVRNSRATLLVCPLSTMTNWKEQLESHFPDGKGLKWVRYHGPERKQMTVNELADHDLVITTYQIISKDTVDQKMPLQQVNWFRIVLDEAHAIRSTSTAQSKAACRLAGQRRWAVTGTPVQNRLEDLGALFQFLRLKPFETPAGFNHHILNPFKLADPEVIPKLQLLVSSVTLRRTKDIIDLPPRQDLIVRLDFAREERRLHDWFEQDTQRKVNAVTAGEKLGGHSYARILTAILNLRLICAHGRDLLSDEALKLTDGMTYENPMEINDEDDEAPALNRQQAYEMLELLDQTNADECQYCRRLVLEVDPQLEEDDAEVPETIGFMTSCYHLVCPRHIKRLRDDWAKIAQPDGFVKCQFCDERVRQVAFELRREDYSAFQDERERIKRDPKLAKKIGGYTGPHTKTQALLKDLEEHRQWSEAHPEEPPIKSVVFSTWTTHLDLIEIALHNHGHKCVRLDGRMSRDARDKSTRLLREDPDVRVILVSIGAGGLGLNLTTANNVYMMEPQFNPAAEAQAVDRVHRLGQNRPVTIKRFIMEQSFEEKMLELQRKKKALAALTMAREKHAKDQAAKKRLEDLRSLFK